jgi:hypothetical protein
MILKNVFKVRADHMGQASGAVSASGAFSVVINPTS